MSQTKKVRCRYGKCLHEERELPAEDAIRIGNAYYHRDCYKLKEDIKMIIEYYANHIEKNPIYGQLNGIVNKLIFEQDISTDYLLFALKYSVTHNGIKIKHPPGLYYLVKDDDIKSAWDYQQVLKQKKSVVVNNKDTTFNYSGKKKKGFADIIGGDSGGIE